MHRLNTILFTAAIALTAACGGKDDAKNPSDKPADPDDIAPGTNDDNAKAKAAAAAREADAGPPEKKNTEICQGFSLSNLEELLSKSDCEAADQNASSMANPDVKGKLEVSASASPNKVSPGAKTDIQVTYTNKTKEPMVLYFRIDPLARFEVEAYDAKTKKRVDMPSGNPPPPPAGQSAPPATEPKVAKITLTPSGYASVRVSWEAVKTKWAPEKVRGTSPEKGYPRKPAGPLPKGKYSLHVVTPLIGVFEGADHEVSAPKLDIEVGG